jgi:adenine-specific DNA-methyltransferase
MPLSSLAVTLNEPTLASVLGFQPYHTPADLLGGRTNPLNQFLDARFGVRQLFRVGGINVDSGSVGLYVAVLDSWGARSSDRDRPRRRIARALVEGYLPDARSVFIMVPNLLQRPTEAEFVLPRSSADLRRGKAANVVSTIRALIELQEPSRFHRELLCELAIGAGASILGISQQWQRTFSVEKATRKFYQEYAGVRDRIAEALKRSNPDHPVIKGMSADQTRAWATRQLGRILFLWFLQSKLWLGYDWPARDCSRYLLTLWGKRDQTKGGYYHEILRPLFFKVLARRNPGEEVRKLLGYTPYLNGGLFRTNPLEDSIEDKGEVMLPDELFNPQDENSVLGLLGRYRFTTRESTPDDQSVDPDPELLGRVFENLYQGDERHDSGTYYTPREVVQFMCRQVIDGYLRDSTGLDQVTLDWVRRQVTEPDEEKNGLSSEKEEALFNALERVRICDPAVGSGAFLLGMMQEIVQLRRGIEHSKRHYIEPEEEDVLVTSWKRRAITWSLYGVDINPEAVEICQLRLWLSLVLDLKDPRKVDPLPNLDFRIVAGDSLVDRVADIVFGESLPRGVYQPPLEWGNRIALEEQNINQWRREFEATQEKPEELRRLRENIVRAYERIVRLHLEASLQRAKDEAHLRSGAGTKKKQAAQIEVRVEQLENLLRKLGQEKSYQKPFLWPVAFPEAMNYPYEGFDVVLANPPYVQMGKIDNEDERVYHATFPEVQASRADLLVYFYGRALQILRPGGWLAFITSNKYMRTAYGEGLRSHLCQKLQLNRVIDFGDLPLFDANGRPVAAYPAVLIGRKNGKEGSNDVLIADLTYPVRSAMAVTNRIVNPENVRWALEDLGSILTENEIQDYPQAMLRREGWILEHPTLVRLFNRLMEQGTPLGEFLKGRIYRGIVTGLNEAFVIDQAKRNELIAEEPRSEELIKAWIRGQDIKQWRVEWAGLYIIFARRGTQIENYPAIREHLAWFRKALEKRATSHIHPWYELQQPQEGIYEEFEHAKLVWPDITSNMRFAWDPGKHYLGNTAYAGIGPKWLLPILNSTLLEFIVRTISTSLRGGYVRLIYQNVTPLPIMEPSESVKSRLSVLTEKDEPEMESIMADLYRLSGEELRLLREWRQKLNSASTEGNEGITNDE